MSSGDIGLQNISKVFGNVCANKSVSFTLRSGTIHGLVGENGAGKSTSMKILFGMITPTSGHVMIDGRPVDNWNVRKAAATGLGMVQQHFHLSDVETAHDNIVLGSESALLGIRNRKAERRKIETLMRNTGLYVPLDQKTGALPIGQKSRCEILKALYSGARRLILDEPTSVLTPYEVNDFLNILKTLRSQGHSILIVTHKLGEIMQVCDEVTVLRAGSTVAQLQTLNTSVDEITRLMVGRTLTLPTKPNHQPNSAANVLEIYDSKAHRFAFTVSSGEVVGIAGVEGNGQDELVGLITRQNLKFEHQGIGVKLFGNELRECDTRTVRSRDLAIVPADRTHDGLVLELSAAENLLLGKKQCGASDFSRIPVQTLETSCLNQMREFDVRPTEPGLPVGAFSGGNQQKLILARELAGITRNGFILAAHPTRGVDLGAIEFIHRQLLDRAESGAGILLISSELSELFALCHKIYVLYKNELRGPFFRDPRNFSFDSEVIGQAMTGLSQKRAQVS